MNKDPMSDQFRMLRNGLIIAQLQLVVPYEITKRAVDAVDKTLNQMKAPRNGKRDPKDVESPLYEILRDMCNLLPPPYINLVGVYQSSELDDDTFSDLQVWCAANSSVEWLVGISMIEAADTMVDEAIKNGNIIPKITK